MPWTTDHREAVSTKHGARWRAVAWLGIALGPTGLGCLAAAVGVAMTIGRATGPPGLSDFPVGSASVIATTGLLIGALGGALILQARPSSRGLARGIALAALVVLLLAGVGRLLDLRLGTVSGAGPGAYWLGPFAPWAVLAVALTALGLLLLGRSWRGVYGSEVLGIVAAAIGAIGMLGSAYGATGLESGGAGTQISFGTALGLLLLGAGMIASNPDHLFASTLRDPRLSGQVARRMVGVSIALLPLAGWAALQLTSGAGLDLAPATALIVVVAGALVITMGVWRISETRHLETHDEAASHTAETADERFRLALDAQTDGTALLTAIRGRAGEIVDFRVAYANRAWPYGPGHRLLEVAPAVASNGLLEALIRVVDSGIGFAVDGFASGATGPPGSPVRNYVDIRAERFDDGVVESVRDVTRRVTEERRTARLAMAVEQSAEAIIMTGPDGAIEYVNPAFERVSGYARDELLGNNPRIVKSEAHGPEFFAAMWAALLSGKSFASELVNRRKDGALYREESVISPVREPDGTITGYVAVKRDITHERALEDEQALIARTRAAIASSLFDLDPSPSPEETAQRICRHVLRLSGLASADVTYFTSDGRASALAFVRRDGVPMSPEPLPLARSRKLRARAVEGPWIEAWVNRRGLPFQAAFSQLGVTSLAHAPILGSGGLIGILSASSTSPSGGADLTRYLPAMLEFAGAAGLLLEPGLRTASDEQDARAKIAAIIAHGDFLTVFQPVIDAASGDPVGYEALTRFAGGVPPDRVFADARSVGLEPDLEMATLQATIAASAGLPPDRWLSINVSPDLVIHGTQLATLLRTTDRPIVLEITEHELVVDYGVLRAAIARIRAGVRVAVDDVGAGHAGFLHLAEIRPDFVKLDIGLIRGIDSDPTRQALIVGILQYCRGAGAVAIAEGVETRAELATLRRLGIAFVQGFLLDRPMSAADAMRRAVERPQLAIRTGSADTGGGRETTKAVRPPPERRSRQGALSTRRSSQSTLHR